MFDTTASKHAEHPSDSAVRLDGDTLVTVLGPVVDFCFYNDVRREIERDTRAVIEQILVDCSSVEKLNASGIAAFIGLDALARERCIRLLIFEPHLGIRKQLRPLLPNALWMHAFLADAGHPRRPH
ncbi:MAG: hypothetical protein P8126_08655 [Gammaproteobacteria bacterium]|jgi:anti-anti-sigma regulatory factor